MNKKLTAIIVFWVIVVLFGWSAIIFTEPGTTFIDYLQLVGYAALFLIGIVAFCGLFWWSIWWATK